MLTPRRRVQAGRLHGALFVPIFILCSTRVTLAQASTTNTREGWVVGALVGRMRIEDVPNSDATSIGVGVTRFTPRRPGVDLAVVTIPHVFGDGQVPLHARVGMAYPLGSGNGLVLLPTIGVDAAVLAGQSAGGWIGYHSGARALFAARQLGIQAGLHWVRAVNAPNSLWLAELGVMRVPALAPPKPRPVTPSAGQF